MKFYRSGKHRGEGAIPLRPSLGRLAVDALDAQLASLAAAGDDSAFTTIVSR